MSDNLPEDIRARLAKMNRQVHSTSRVSETAKKSQESSRAEELARGLGGRAIARSAGQYVEIEREHTQSDVHGIITVNKHLLRKEFCSSHFDSRTIAQNIPVEDLLFLDTETTGLGGIGTVAFMVGIARIHGGSLVTRQFVMTDFCDEAGMLEAVLAEFSSTTALVTYNGRAFDLPILLDRMVVNRVAREIPMATHIDALYPIRSLYKRRLQSCSLKNIEREIFDFHREDDIPGHLVPAAYFAWLHGDDYAELQRVIEHNRLDIVSLALLTGLISHHHVTCGADLTHPEDIYSFIRLQERLRKLDTAADICAIRASELDTCADPQIVMGRSQTFKRAGRVAPALALWEALAANGGPYGHRARVELAKYHEHVSRDLRQALVITQRARELLRLGAHELEPLRKRERRLLAKLATASGRQKPIAIESSVSKS